MLVVTGIVQIAPEDVEVLRSAARIAAAATRQEPGCVIYEFSEDIETPGRFRVYEEWRSAEDLAAHGKAPHMKAFRAALADATFLGRDLVTFTRGEASPL